MSNLNLTLRTLLAYLDDTLSPEDTRALGEKVAASPDAKKLIERIKTATRRRGLPTPVADGSEDDVGDPNVVAEYLSDTLDVDQVTALEQACLADDARLAEVAAVHQILSLVLAEPVRVAPQANQRMYKLVEAPAALPSRRSGKAVPVAGVMDPDADDSDAPLLLGLGRYSRGESSGGRLGVVAAVAFLGVGLVLAVMMALPRDRADAPPVRPATVVASNTAPPPRDTDATAPSDDPDQKKAKPKEPEKKEPEKKEPEKKSADEKKPADEKKVPDKDLVNEGVPPPIDARVPLGRVATPNVLVVSRADAATAWTRLSPDAEQPVTGSDQVMALPGFKADVRLDSDVDVHLWGSVPELYPPRPGTARVPMEARVRFHKPQQKIDGKGEDFDADLTLLGGRVYLSQNAKKPKAGGARVRVRVLDEVWDVMLPDPKAEVMVEVTTAYVPGTPFAREGTEKPRSDAKLVVVRGVADVAMPKRARALPKVAAPAVLVWDSAGGVVSAPKPVEKGDGSFDKIMLVESEQGREVQKALADLAARVTDKTPIRVVIDERLNEPIDPRRMTVTRIAAYAKIAITSPASAATDLKPVLDALADSARFYARSAAVNVLAVWVAREPQNPAAFREAVVAKFNTPDADADLMVRLLFGYLPPGKPDPVALDRLVELLAHPSIVVRELALWNLVTFADPDAGPAGLMFDVSQNTGPMYEKYLRAWKARAEEIKKK